MPLRNLIAGIHPRLAVVLHDMLMVWVAWIAISMLRWSLEANPPPLSLRRSSMLSLCRRPFQSIAYPSSVGGSRGTRRVAHPHDYPNRSGKSQNFSGPKTATPVPLGNTADGIGSPRASPGRIPSAGAVDNRRERPATA